ncbi:MAG: ABC transporter permease, partial [Chloroflexota bacterium]
TRKQVVEAVKGVDLTVKRGEIFGFLGPNGAGKTTTLRMLATLLPPSGGEATVAGVDLKKDPGKVRERIGYIGQKGGTDIGVSGRDELMLQCRLYGMSKHEAQERTQAAVRTLLPAADQEPGLGGDRVASAHPLPGPLRAPAEVDRGRSRLPAGGAYNVFVPGLLIQLGLFGASGVGFPLIAELRAGVVERFRVTPVSRLALLLGRALRDILTLLIQSILLIVASIPFGLTITLPAALVVLGLVALIGIMMASTSYAVALWLRSEDAYAPLVFTATLPLLLLSGVLLPMTLAPDWLRRVAALNPLAYAVDAARAAFLLHLDDPSVVKGLLIISVLAVIAILGAARSFGRAVA